MRLFRKKTPKVLEALCLTDFYWQGKSYRANLDKVLVTDAIFKNQPFMFMVLENEDSNG